MGQPKLHSLRPVSRGFGSVLAGVALGVAAFTGACSSKQSSDASAGPGGNAAVSSIEVGTLVDVLGLRRTASGSFTAVPYRADVLIGPNVVDQRDGRTSNKKDNEIDWDFLSANPDTLQPRLLIPREIGSPEFQRIFDALDDRTREIAPGLFGQNTTQSPFSVAPRDAAIRLRFTRNLGIDAGFFYTLDQNGMITGVKNTEAVQLLKIVGDPNDADPVGDFEVLPTRVVVRGNELILDPVLLGVEGVQLQVRNSAAGMPEAPDQVGANIRLALALEGPLAIPGVQKDQAGALVGKNNAGQRSFIRDFRSGNRLDNSAEISRGFRRDPVPPRLVGEMVMYLEKVEEVDEFTQLVTVYKGDVVHRIDGGDAMRVVTLNGNGLPVAVTEIVQSPNDVATNTHVSVLVRREQGLTDVDPSKQPGYPSDRVQREAWLRANAPRAVLVAEYEYGDGQDSDDPQYFVTFTPGPLPDPLTGEPSPANQNISPFAAAIVRFSKPVDIDTVRAQDSLFFAMRPLYGDDGDAFIADYIANSNIDPTTFSRDKFLTPFLVVGNRNDENGSQTTIRLQPPLGFFLDDTMRQMGNEEFRTYYLHVLGGASGIRDLAGNQLDLQPAPQFIQEALVIDFTIDVRNDSLGVPLFPNNRVVNIARRFAAQDEDEQPSMLRRDEIAVLNGAVNEKAYPLEDLFGSVSYLNGRIQGRPTARISQVADNQNQQPPPSQESDLRWCPFTVNGEGQVPANTAAVPFGAPIQNPLNPYGCRLQTIWREIDLNLSRVEPADFNLDVEELHWAPHAGSTITFDEFDRMSLFLGHAEYRPENCVGETSSLPSPMGSSGLQPAFSDNYAHNNNLRGGEESPGPHYPPPHTGYVEHYVVLDASLAFTEPNGINRFMPLPPLQKPYFVWRDETAVVQGANASTGSDVRTNLQTFDPYIISPFLMGGGRFVNSKDGSLVNVLGRWINMANYNMRSGTNNTLEKNTGGLVGSIGLPLLGDFQMLPDEATLPEGRGYVASGVNGWQISLTVQSSSIPNFRVYSAGGVAGGQTRTVAPGTSEWSRAAGGLNPLNNQRTPPGDNSFYWVQYDFMRRTTVATFGFVDVLNPHRVGEGTNAIVTDPRIGPYYPSDSRDAVLPSNVVPTFATLFEPPLASLPGGTELVAQYRGASVMDASTWIWNMNLNGNLPQFKHWRDGGQVAPDYLNFPLDPRKAGDAHIRKYDNRNGRTGQPRNYWVYPYNYNVTDYVEDINTLADARFLAQFAGPVDSFRPNEMRYFNWRFVMNNNVDATPPVSPELESFAVIYRFEEN